jgi:hypothetical protein
MGPGVGSGVGEADGVTEWSQFTEQEIEMVHSTTRDFPELLPFPLF